MARSPPSPKSAAAQPVDDYLRLQKRYAHLFGSHPRPDIVARLQALADKNIKRFNLLEEGGMTMKKPFAITLDPGSSLANKTGSWRTERPVYVDRLPPCNHQCPAGEDIQGWLYHAESGGYEAAWRHLTRDNPFPGDHGAGLLSYLRKRLQPGQTRYAPWGSTRSSGFWAMRR